HVGGSATPKMGCPHGSSGLRRRTTGGGPPRGCRALPASELIGAAIVFIVIEGGDGTGKSTLARGLARSFPEALVVREPGGTPLGEGLRRLLLDRDMSMRPVAEMLLFAAARAQLVADVIGPALEAGRFVICDRFVDSS